jgi:hypothetical protein
MIWSRWKQPPRGVYIELPGIIHHSLWRAAVPYSLSAAVASAVGSGFFCSVENLKEEKK